MNLGSLRRRHIVPVIGICTVTARTRRQQRIPQGDANLAMTYTQGLPPWRFSTLSLFFDPSLTNSSSRYLMTILSTFSGVMSGTSRIENLPDTLGANQPDTFPGELRPQHTVDVCRLHRKRENN